MPAKMGRLIGASLGPGDPELMTRAAWSAVANADCWAWPIGRKDGQSYALSIVARTDLAQPATTLPLYFPMTRDSNELAVHWQIAAAQTLAVLESGIDVVFLVEGDASFYSTFGHLVRTLRTLTTAVVIDVIPGVSSPLAAAALAGNALCEGDERVAIIPATVEMSEFDTLLKTFDTIVLMKIRPVLQQILERLQHHSLLHRAVFVERAGTPQQRVVQNVAQLHGSQVHYLSLMIVHTDNAN